MRKMYYYDVYVRTSHGTVKRMVTLPNRSVFDAGEKARHEVMRYSREDVEILDVVPLRVIEGETVTTGRGSKMVKTRAMKFKQSRRPHARASAKLKRAGKALKSDEPTVVDYVPVTEKMSDSEPKPEFGVCESPACVERGYCTSLHR